MPAPIFLGRPLGGAVLKPAVPLPMPRNSQSQSNKPRAEEAPWWVQPKAPPAAPALEEVHWRPKYPQPSLADSVEMGKPVPYNPMSRYLQQ